MMGRCPYDLPDDEAVEAMAWWMARTEEPRCWQTVSPQTLGDTGRLHARRRAKVDP